MTPWRAAITFALIGFGCCLIAYEFAALVAWTIEQWWPV